MKSQHILPVLLVYTSLLTSAQSREELVEFSNGSIKLSGTLSFPEKSSPREKAIILVSGSGPQNRDSEIVGFKPFKLLADYFNAQGYAVLRYDDRGVGRSTGKSVNESTTKELAEDARQAFLYLKSRTDIDNKNIGLLGHSEGGIIVPLVISKEKDVAFAILMAGYGVKGVELSNRQQLAILKSSGMGDAYIEAMQDFNRKVMAMMSDTTVSEETLSNYVKKNIVETVPLLPEAMQQQISDKEAYATLVSQQVIAQTKSPWIRFYMNYDPYPALTAITCPVLLLFGELDTQVVPEQNEGIMKQALVKNKQVTSVIIPKANHLFQEAVTGSPAEYATLKKEFAPEIFETITNWLKVL